MIGGLMTRLVTLFFITFFLSFSAHAFECIATYETVDENEQVVSKNQILELQAETTATTRMTTDIGLYHYFAQYQKKSQSFLLMITFGPNYESGVTSSMTWDKSGQVRLARVEGVDVYKLVCKK